MQALRLHRDSGVTLELEQAPIPAPGPDQLLVRIHASAIQPSDLMNAAGGFPYTTFPRIPGRDFAGTVVGGSREREGQAVFGTSGCTYAFTADGFQAEYAVVSAKSAIAKPEALSFVQAATLGVPLSTAVLALERSGARKDETVLVIGANGAVGTSVVALASAMGCRVLRAMRGPGGDADTLNDPKLENVKGLIAGQGCDIVIDTVGSPSLTVAAMRRLANGGRLAYITAPKEGGTDLTFDMKDAYRREIALIGCNSLLKSPEEAGKHMEAAIELLGDRIHDLAANQRWQEVSLKDAVEVYRIADKRQKKVIRII